MAIYWGENGVEQQLGNVTNFPSQSIGQSTRSSTQKNIELYKVRENPPP